LSLCCALKRKQVDGRMAAEVISDQQLRPESRDNISASSEAAAGTSHQPVQRRRGASLVRLLVPVVALLLVLSVARVLGPSALRTYQSRRAGEVRSLDLRPLPPSVPVPVVANTSKPIVAEPTPKAEPIEVTVEPHQRLGDIALQYLGSADLQSLRQIQALNPKLIDPNHIEPGQKIRLPDPLAAPVSENAALPANVRNLP
jgi:nucleoid-associated protein YgaU